MYKKVIAILKLLFTFVPETFIHFHYVLLINVELLVCTACPIPRERSVCTQLKGTGYNSAPARNYFCMKQNINTIDEYIVQFPQDIQNTLREMRSFIKGEATEATEKISYGMPTFYLNGNLVHFAAFKDHYGFFPSPSGIDGFEKELAPYYGGNYYDGKGALHFDFNKPIPWDLIKKVIQFRIAENLKKSSRGKEAS
jgi:uncharacterized protein YdhG (YjbR/CyaY superfamily)